VRSRGWVIVTVVVVLAVVFAGLGASLFLGGGASEPTPTPRPSPVAPSLAPGQAASFELRQVYFQESGDIQRKPPIPPGPADGGKDATGDLLRVDCNLPPRPAAPDDNVILCDSFGFRYGLGPSELPPDGVADAIALQGAFDDWVVQVTLTDDAASVFEDVTKRVSTLGPPLNQLAIVLNGAVVSAPAVQEPIKGGTLQITGGFTQGEAEALATALG
jgi:hypothetical protein